MPAITPTFTMQYERRMRSIKEDEYIRRLNSKHTWWNKACRPLPIEGKTLRMAWFLDTAQILPTGPNNTANVSYEGLVTQTAEYTTYHHGRGLKVLEDQLEDLDGTGLDQAAKWSANIGNDSAYYPQRLLSQFLLNGANTDGSANAYDGVPFFADNTTNGGIGHPYNPFKANIGGYANWYHGAASGTYPGALPIDESVTVDVAVRNLGIAIAAVASLRMPNGVDPRFLTPAYLIGPPRLAPRLRQITDAKFIAQAAAAGGGSGDVSALIEGWGLGTPVIAQELSAATTYHFDSPFVAQPSGNDTYISETVTGSDTSWYMVCQELQTTQLGGMLYVTRKPFKVQYWGPDAIPILARQHRLEYLVDGRMSEQYGHPYTIFRIDAS